MPFFGEILSARMPPGIYRIMLPMVYMVISIPDWVLEMSMAAICASYRIYLMYGRQ